MNDFTIEHFTKCLNSFASKDDINFYLKYIYELFDEINNHNFMKKDIGIFEVYSKNMWSLCACKKCKLHIIYIAKPYKTLELRLYTNFDIGKQFFQNKTFSVYKDCNIKYTKENLLKMIKKLKENTCKSRIMKLACY